MCLIAIFLKSLVILTNDPPTTIIFNQNAIFLKPAKNNTVKSQCNSKQEKVPKQPPYTVVQTLATRLRKIYEAQCPNIVLRTKHKQTTK